MSTLAAHVLRIVLGPLRAVPTAATPLLMVYVASGATGVIAIAETFWLKTALTLSPAELAAIAIWLQLPWTAKMVVGAMVDALPLAGSRRRTYLRLGAGLMAAGFALLALAGTGWASQTLAAKLYLAGQLMVVLGGVFQEVVADAISGEIISAVDADGMPRAAAEITADLSRVQVLARFAYGVGALLAAALSGILAASFSYAQVCLLALAVPALSLLGGSLLARVDTTSGATGQGTVDRRVVGAGLWLMAGAAVIAIADLPFAQEAILLLALATLSAIATRLTGSLAPDVRHRLFALAAAAFAFRAAPTLGEGYRWFTIDRLGFDEHFLGTLQVTGIALGLVLTWLLAGALDRRQPRVVFLALTLTAAVLWVPSLLLSRGVHEWTAAHLGIGARGLALIDESVQTPLGLLATVPLMALVAQHAPAAQRATWFALAAAVMSLAIVASQLLTKYINLVFVIERGAYGDVAPMVLSVLGMSLVLPIAALVLLWRRMS